MTVEEEEEAAMICILEGKIRATVPNTIKMATAASNSPIDEDIPTEWTITKINIPTTTLAKDPPTVKTIWEWAIETTNERIRI